MYVTDVSLHFARSGCADLSHLQILCKQTSVPILNRLNEAMCCRDVMRADSFQSFFPFCCRLLSPTGTVGKLLDAPVKRTYGQWEKLKWTNTNASKLKAKSSTSTQLFQTQYIFYGNMPNQGLGSGQCPNIPFLGSLMSVIKMHNFFCFM